MTYATEFPNMGEDTACAAMAARGADCWEDTSWHNDVCPSFTCDVFVLFCDHANPMEREFHNGPRFTMHCEGHVYLATDVWADVLAFMDDGKRDFPDYAYRWDTPALDALVAEFAAWTASQGISAEEGDAQELLMVDRTSDQRAWLRDFITRWDAAQAEADARR